VINGKPTIHEEGRMILIRDKDAHSLKGGCFSYVNLAFPPDRLDRLALFAGAEGLRSGIEAGDDPPNVLIPPEDRRRMEDLFDRLLRAADRPTAGFTFAAALLELLARYDFPGQDRAETVGGEPRWFAELLRWAEREEGRPSPREFCLKSGYSREHVIRETRRNLGMTPSAYLAGLRLKRSRDLLQFTNYPIIRIAQETGWESIRQFQRKFTESSGCTPSEYRKRRALLAH
jgi:AraC family cel operon transcriptional repressor